MQLESLITGKQYKIENGKIYVDLGCGWFKSDYTLEEVETFMIKGEMKKIS